MRISDWSSDVCSSDLSFRRTAFVDHPVFGLDDLRIASPVPPEQASDCGDRKSDGAERRETDEEDHRKKGEPGEQEHRPDADYAEHRQGHEPAPGGDEVRSVAHLHG